MGHQLLVIYVHYWIQYINWWDNLDGYYEIGFIDGYLHLLRRMCFGRFPSGHLKHLQLPDQTIQDFHGPMVGYPVVPMAFSLSTLMES